MLERTLKALQRQTGLLKMAWNEWELMQHEQTEIRPMAGCVAGTLVHTDKGLVPIQDIQVGDRLLSRREYNTGENEYKQVLKTFRGTKNL